MEGVKYRVVHHTGTIFPITPWDVAVYHVTAPHLLWPGAGYDLGIDEEGTVWLMNYLKTMNYGVAERNHECVHLVVFGSFLAGRQPTLAQKIAIPQALAWMDSQLPQATEIVGHGEIALSGHGTSCPGDVSYR